jgi:hypothetical protein
LMNSAARRVDSWVPVRVSKIEMVTSSRSFGVRT